jgi:hypothetical protein
VEEAPSTRASWRRKTAAGVSRRSGSWLALVALIAVSTGVRAWAARETAGPWISPDEMIYSLSGFSLYHSGHLDILGGPTPYYSFLVPAFAGLPLSVGNFNFGYGLLKVFQALAMSMAALPVYLWSRSRVSARWALTAVALTLAVPGLAYSGLIMTEVLFYPLLTLWAWAMACAIARPARRNQAFVVAATFVLAATRLQAIVLFPAFATALVLYALLGRSATGLRRLWPTLVALSVMAVAWLAWRLAAGGSLLAGYAAVADTSYSVGGAAKFVAYHAASLLILTGVFPVCALAVMLIEGFLTGERLPEARAYLAVASSMSLWFVLEVGVFASEHVGRLAERDLLGLAPILFIGFSLWLQRGGPRLFSVAAGAAIAAAALLLFLPLDEMVTVFGAQDAFTLIPLLKLREMTSFQTLEIVFAAVTAFAVLLFALLPRRLLIVLPALLLAALLAASVSASYYVHDKASEQRVNFLGSNPRWVDRAAAGPVAYVYDGEPNWDAVWHTLFWNRKIRSIYDLPGVAVPGPLPQRNTFLSPSGRLVSGGRTDDVPYAVMSTAFTLVGRPVAQISQRSVEQAGLRLWQIEGPLRISTHVTGLDFGGDIHPGGDGQLLAYGCRSGYHFLATILVKTRTTIELRRNGSAYRRLEYPSARPNKILRLRVPTVEGTGPDVGTCKLDVRSSGLIGTTLFDIERG